jgi:hypothetical protein
VFFGFKWWLILGPTHSATPKTLHGLPLSNKGVTSTKGYGNLKGWKYPGNKKVFTKVGNDGKLDFKGSFTIAVMFYQDTARDGPILEWRGSKGRPFGTHFWIYQGKLFVNIKPKNGNLPQHFKKVPAKSWHFIGVSYNSNTGDLLMWIDKDVQLNKKARVIPDTSGDVYTGIRPSGGKPHTPLKAVLSGLTVLKGAISTKDQVKQLKKNILKSAGNVMQFVDGVVVLDHSSRLRP